MSAQYLDEIHSFASKFAYLCSLGFTASLTFNSCHGKLRANLDVDLEPMQFPTSSFKPSKIRRRRRRQSAQNRNRNHDTTHMECSEVESSLSSETIPRGELEQLEQSEVDCDLPLANNSEFDAVDDKENP